MDIQKWIDSLPALIPIEAITNHQDTSVIAAYLDANPASAGSLTEAMLWLRIGFIDRPHEIVQHGTTSMERYLHGVVHRLEGDYWNAKYWFRQVNDGALTTKIGVAVASALRDHDVQSLLKTSQVIDRKDRFEPSAFVDACQAHRRDSNSAHRETDLAKLEKIGYAEWVSLWRLV